jgi:hypothetical protein
MMKHKMTGAILMSLMMAFSLGCEGLLDTDPQQSVAPEIALGTPEVDHPVDALVPAAAPARGDPAVVV